MGFYSTITNEDIRTSYFDTEEQARDMVLALYNGESFTAAARFSPRFEEMDNPVNIPGDFISSTKGNPFTKAIFKERMMIEETEDKLVKGREFKSARTQRIFDEVLIDITGEDRKTDTYPHLVEFADKFFVRVEDDKHIRSEDRIATAELNDEAWAWLRRNYPGTPMPGRTEFNNFISKHFGVSQKRNGTMTWLNLGRKKQVYFQIDDANGDHTKLVDSQEAVTEILEALPQGRWVKVRKVLI